MSRQVSVSVRMSDFPGSHRDYSVGILLLAVVIRLPIPGYILLRIVICGSAIACAAFRYGWNRNYHPKSEQIEICVWLAVIVIFNPFLPLHLAVSTWRILDGLTALAFGGAGTNTTHYLYGNSYCDKLSQTINQRA
jgi:hypothetical protein